MVDLGEGDCDMVSYNARCLFANLGPSIQCPHSAVYLRTVANMIDCHLPVKSEQYLKTHHHLLLCFKTCCFFSFFFSFFFMSMPATQIIYSREKPGPQNTEHFLQHITKTKNVYTQCCPSGGRPTISQYYKKHPHGYFAWVAFCNEKMFQELYQK